jgi:oligogalacturonide lyase
MVGRKWASEMSVFVDEKTGRTIRQLTTTGNNVHMYFTENSFVEGKNEIIFQSDRASGADKAPHEDPQYAIFRMSLDTGEIEQLTDDVVSSPHAVTKTPEGQLIAYSTENCVKVLDLNTGNTTVVFQETGILRSVVSHRLHPIAAM